MRKVTLFTREELVDMLNGGATRLGDYQFEMEKTCGNIGASHPNKVKHTVDLRSMDSEHFEYLIGFWGDMRSMGLLEMTFESEDGEVFAPFGRNNNAPYHIRLCMSS